LYVVGRQVPHGDVPIVQGPAADKLQEHLQDLEALGLVDPQFAKGLRFRLDPSLAAEDAPKPLVALPVMAEALELVVLSGGG
jgi:hypothetical protein